MRYGIFSDVHSNLEALEAVLSAYKEELIDKYLCIGDLVGYASNPAECIEKVRDAATITVAGNHDWATVDLFSLDCFNPFARQAVIWTRHKLNRQQLYFLESLRLVYSNDDLTFVHGTLDSPEDFNYLTDIDFAQATFAALETTVCFVGHTHVPEIFIKDKEGELHYLQGDSCSIEQGNKYIVNVGSVGQPRDGNPESAYCIYDTDKKEFQIKRTKYDVELTRKKIIEAGLPKFLGDRLLSGR